jgi:Fe-S cluster biogenesis protein NfuA
MELLKKSDLLIRIEQSLETMRDFLRADGGDVELIDIENDMTVKIRLLGQCRSCSMSVMTMKAGIEEAVRKAIPEVKEVIAINEEDLKLI